MRQELRQVACAVADWRSIVGQCALSAEALTSSAAGRSNAHSRSARPGGREGRSRPPDGQGPHWTSAIVLSVPSIEFASRLEGSARWPSQLRQHAAPDQDPYTTSADAKSWCRTNLSCSAILRTRRGTSSTSRRRAMHRVGRYGAPKAATHRRAGTNKDVVSRGTPDAAITACWQ
jgi:hypothetical protein